MTKPAKTYNMSMADIYSAYTSGRLKFEDKAVISDGILECGDMDGHIHWFYTGDRMPYSPDYLHDAAEAMLQGRYMRRLFLSEGPDGSLTVMHGPVHNEEAFMAAVLFMSGHMHMMDWASSYPTSDQLGADESRMSVMPCISCAICTYDMTDIEKSDFRRCMTL
jgi:hypothetical protein